MLNRLRRELSRTVQLDELYAPTVQPKQSEAELLAWPDERPLWLWTAMDPVSKLLLVGMVGQRSLAVAQTVVHLVKQRLAPGCLPLFTTDGLAHYQTALLTHFGHWLQPPPTPSGRTRKPRWFPLPGLLYAQFIKHRRRRRIVCIKQRLVFGDWPQVQVVLDRLDWKINTAFVERLNRSAELTTKPDHPPAHPRSRPPGYPARPFRHRPLSPGRSVPDLL